ncbi:MAG: hypothetical protein WD751_03420 [Anaerolineales bacterium]
MEFLKRRAFANVTWGELLFVGVAATLAAWISWALVHFRGTEWDTLLYLNTAQSPEPNGAILNRYTHIYLQKIFLLFFSPLDAAKALWAFQIYATGVLVYLCAKLLNPRNGVLTGAFALLFYFAQRELFTRSGVPLVDFTTMHLIVIGVFIFLLYLRSEKRPAALLILLGLVQFLLLKSKETGIIAVPLLTGAVLLSARDWRGRGHAALLVLGGGLAGIALFVVLDGLFLGDPLFSLRPENWRALLTFNLTLVYEQRASESWFYHLFTTALLIPFLFSVFVLLDDKKGDYGLGERMIWTVPLIHILFLSVVIFRASFPLHFRYFYPSIPIIAILGAQFLQWRDRKQRQRAWILLAASAAVAGLLLLFLYPFAAGLTYRWTEENFFSSIVTGLVLAGLFGVLLLNDSPKWSRSLLLIPFVAILLFTPVLRIPSEMAATRQISELGFSPFSIYKENIVVREGARLFFSGQPYAEYGILGRNSGSSEYMLEAYFDVQIERVDYSEDILDVLLGDYDYGFVTRAEFATAFIDDDLAQKGYTVVDDPRSEIILIARMAP